MMTPETVLSFWFEQIDPKKWWEKDIEFDTQLKKRFEKTLIQAKQGELYHWRVTPEGRLAEIIVLDQFSRNIYRDTPQAFEADTLALILAQEAVAHNADTELHDKQVPFLFMPYMHSESQAIHEVAMVLFSRDSASSSLEFERRHKEIIDQFGRYPHRNAILGRKSTEEEINFLKQPGSSF